jgi:hypothetical protein
MLMFEGYQDPHGRPAMSFSTIASITSLLLRRGLLTTTSTHKIDDSLHQQSLQLKIFMGDSEVGSTS